MISKAFTPDGKEYFTVSFGTIEEAQFAMRAVSELSVTGKGFSSSAEVKMLQEIESSIIKTLSNHPEGRTEKQIKQTISRRKFIARPPLGGKWAFGEVWRLISRSIHKLESSAKIVLRKDKYYLI